VRFWPNIVYHWGSTASERRRTFACDSLLGDADEVLFRAVDVDADAAVVFRWLCQLRAAPYSYDKLDNGGRRSPQTLTPGLERLEVGQRAMSIFRITEFEQDRSITVFSQGRVFGRVACTYHVEERGRGHSRLLVKMRVSHNRHRLASLPMRLVLAPGDLLMMRRQLLNLKALAERDGQPLERGDTNG
jgi:hypothetical protein